MAQSYYPVSRSGLPSPVKESVLTSLNGDKHFRVDDVQDAYVDQKDRLVKAIDSTKSILSDLLDFSKDEWVIRYPQTSQQDAESQENTTEQHKADSKLSHETLRPAAGFHVLRLDLKLGAHGSSTSSTSLVSQLEKSSIANLLGERIVASITHIERLRLRVEDTSSKVLVTGDLNAGKSTFVNALLRREVMPVDQQPCTTVFCEVHDATENGGKEEVHVLKEAVAYDIMDESTFTRKNIADLEHVVTESEISQQKLRLYLADTRSPSESLLNNGVVDISLIDAPGLNRDSLKTTAVFARQEEIDVVVFVVSAENHFTLSAREFLANASSEKAYLFIVVNKFDQIKNKDKCRRLVLEQIKELSPATYEDAADLVHFVDSASALFTPNPSFDDLESSLRSFVLVKRSKSKLQPVSTYLSNLLSDVDFLASANALMADSELECAVDDLNRARPVLEKMKSEREALDEGLEAVEEEGASIAIAKTKITLNNALDRVGQGKLGVDTSNVTMPTYPGLLGIWNYAREVRKALLLSLDLAVNLAEDESRAVTSAGVAKITRLGDDYLPEGVERSRRVFMPEAMFSARAWKKGGKSKSRRLSNLSSVMGGAVVAGGVHGLGIGLAQRPDMLETTFFDLFDLHHQFWVHFGEGKDGGKDEALEDEDSTPSALSLISVGVGALSMVGGQAIGARALIEGIIRVTDLFGNETARKWAAPVIGAITIGLTAYLVLELPSTIPRTVGRRIRGSLVKRRRRGGVDDSEGGQEELLYVNVHAGRISRETRKVLRLASWDLRERFRGAMEERGKEVKGAEEMERRARRAKEWFEELGKQSVAVRADTELGS